MLPLLLYLMFMNVTLINDILICIFRFVPPHHRNSMKTFFFFFSSPDASTLFWFLFLMLLFLLLFTDNGRTILYGNCFEPEIKSTSINHFFLFHRFCLMEIVRVVNEVAWRMQSKIRFVQREYVETEILRTASFVFLAWNLQFDMFFYIDFGTQRQFFIAFLKCSTFFFSCVFHVSQETRFRWKLPIC